MPNMHMVVLGVNDVWHSPCLGYSDKGFVQLVESTFEADPNVKQYTVPCADQ